MFYFTLLLLYFFFCFNAVRNDLELNETKPRDARVGRNNTVIDFFFIFVRAFCPASFFLFLRTDREWGGIPDPKFFSLRQHFVFSFYAMRIVGKAIIYIEHGIREKESACKKCLQLFHSYIRHLYTVFLFPGMSVFKKSLHNNPVLILHGSSIIYINSFKLCVSVRIIKAF